MNQLMRLQVVEFYYIAMRY